MSLIVQMSLKQLHNSFSFLLQGFILVVATAAIKHFCVFGFILVLL